MKWLFFILLIACQNKTPPYQDLSDNDGDGKRDIDEILAGSDPMISEMKTLPVLEMTLEHPDLSINITNAFDVNQGLATLATKPTLSKLPHDLLAGKRGLVKISNLKNLDQKSYDLNLFLKVEGSEKIVMTLGRKIFDLKPGLKISLTKEEILSLKNGQLKVGFEGESEDRIESIHSKTYKVIYVTETGSSLYYVSNSLSFKDFLRSKRLEEPKELKMEDLFYQKHEDDKSLWVRKVDQDLALFELSSKDLHKNHMKNFEVIADEIVRKNGVGIYKSMKLSSTGKTIFQVKGSKVSRHFSIIEGTPISEGCSGGKILVYSARNEAPLTQPSHLIKQNLDLNLEEVESRNFENDLFLSTGPETRLFQLALKQLPSETYQNSGYESLKCPYSEENLTHPQRLNQEVEFKLNITSYLEKDGF